MNSHINAAVPRRPLPARAATPTLALLLCLALPSEARARAYEFINITDSSGPLSIRLWTPPAINGDGTVVFITSRDDGNRVVFAGNGGPLRSVAAPGGPIREIDLSADINDAGTVAFLAAVPGDHSLSAAIFTADQSGSFTNVATGYLEGLCASGTCVLPRPTLTGLHIDDSGAVTYSQSGPATLSIRTWRDGKVSTVAETGETFRNLGAWVTSRSGSTAFIAQGQDLQRALYLYEQGALRQVADASDFPGSLSTARLAINDGGTIAVLTEQQAIHLVDDGGIRPFVTEAGAFGSVSTAGINSDGTVAFRATLDAGGTGIFTGPDPVHDKVIATGDPFLGSTIMSMSFQKNGINDNGDIAFYYELLDGRRGVAVARVVPEPGGIAVLLGIGVSLLPRRRQPVCGR